MSPNQLPPPAGGPSTREIPVVVPAGATAVGATAAGATAAGATAVAATAVAATPAAPSGVPLATGPVDYVPGPPPAGAAPGVLPTTELPRPAPDFVVDLSDDGDRPHRRLGARPVAVVLGAAAAVVLEISLLLHGGGQTLWARVPLWSAFATLAVLAGLAGVLARLAGRQALRSLAPAGLAGLGLFWLQVALPIGDTDRGFLLTAAFGCLGAATWLSARGGAVVDRENPAPSA